MWSKTLPPQTGVFFTGPGREAFRISGWLDCNSEQGVMQVFSAKSAAQSLRGNKQRNRGKFKHQAYSIYNPRISLNSPYQNYITFLGCSPPYQN